MGSQKKIKQESIKPNLGQMGFGGVGCWKGIDCSNFVFGRNWFGKGGHQDFIQSPLVQIGKDRLPEKNQRGIYKTQFGPDKVWRGWMLEGYRLLKFWFWSKLVWKGWPTGFYTKPLGPDRRR